MPSRNGWSGRGGGASCPNCSTRAINIKEVAGPGGIKRYYHCPNCGANFYVEGWQAGGGKVDYYNLNPELRRARDVALAARESRRARRTAALGGVPATVPQPRGVTARLAMMIGLGVKCLYCGLDLQETEDPEILTCTAQGGCNRTYKTSHLYSMLRSRLLTFALLVVGGFVAMSVFSAFGAQLSGMLIFLAALFLGLEYLFLPRKPAVQGLAFAKIGFRVMEIIFFALAFGLVFAVWLAFIIVFIGYLTFPLAEETKEDSEKAMHRAAYHARLFVGFILTGLLILVFWGSIGETGGLAIILGIALISISYFVVPKIETED